MILKAGAIALALACAAPAAQAVGQCRLQAGAAEPHVMAENDRSRT